MDAQELELLEGFRRLCTSDRNMLLTAVSMVLSAEEAMRRECKLSRKCPICGAEKCRSENAISSERTVQEIDTD